MSKKLVLNGGIRLPKALTKKRTIPKERLAKIIKGSPLFSIHLKTKNSS